MFPPIGLRGQLAISSPIWCPQPGTIVSDRWRKSETFYAQSKSAQKSAEENIAPKNTQTSLTVPTALNCVCSVEKI